MEKATAPKLAKDYLTELGENEEKLPKGETITLSMIESVNGGMGWDCANPNQEVAMAGNQRTPVLSTERWNFYLAISKRK